MTVYGSDDGHRIALFNPPTADNTPSSYPIPKPWEEITDKESKSLVWRANRSIIDDWSEPDDYREAMKLRKWDPMGTEYRSNMKVVPPDPETGVPRNPIGSTGVSGIGYLPVWGQNSALILAITKESQSTQSGLINYEFAVYSNQMGSQLPWFLIRHPKECTGLTCQEDLINLLTRKRTEELVRVNPLYRSIYEESLGCIRRAQKTRIYTGYLHDMISTDNAWLECTAIHIHLGPSTPTTDTVLQLIALEGTELEWTSADTQTNMRDSHRIIMFKVVSASTRGKKPKAH